MPTLAEDAVAFLQLRFPGATVLHKHYPLRRGALDGPVVKTMTGCVAHGFDGGVRQLLFAVPELGVAETTMICSQLDFFRGDLDGAVMVVAGHVDDPHDNRMANSELSWSAVVVLFTDRLGAPSADIRAAGNGVRLEIVDEGTRSLRVRSDVHTRFSAHDSVFVSYGGPDEAAAMRIDGALRAHGVSTWIFARDALPGQKLHRIMSDGVREHDRVLLICSRHALSRPGVLNEIERVLEREAREGGSEVLLPVRLDDFVLGDWAPARRDLADQVRSRVIGNLSCWESDVAAFDREIEKVVQALARPGRRRG